LRLSAPVSHFRQTATFAESSGLESEVKYVRATIASFGGKEPHMGKWPFSVEARGNFRNHV